jgi:tetratricopeptide (TPR) repeat protein
LVLAFIVATGVFTFVMTVSALFSNTPIMAAFSTRLSDFLAPQIPSEMSAAAPESSWHHAFMDRFDHYFGTGFLPLRGVAISVLVSVVSVIFFAVLLSGSLETRAFWNGAEAAPLYVLGLGVAINTVPDYLSLRLTRTIVGRMSRHPGVLAQSLWIGVDLISSGLIIWFAIHVWRFALDEPVLSLPEVMGLFSPYAIFFFSTFTTSLAAMVFFLVQLIKRILTQWRYGRAFCAALSAEKNPVLIFGVAQYLVLVPVFFAVFLAMSKDEEGITQFDNLVCAAAGERMCFYLTRLSAEDASKLTYLRRGCTGGLTLECFQSAQAVLKLPAEDAEALLQNACAIEDTDACGLVFDLDALKGTWKISPATLDVTCGRDRPGACFVRGARKLTNPKDLLARAEGVADLTSACEGGIARACYSLGALYASEEVPGGAPVRVTGLFKRGCDLGALPSCAALGARKLEGFGGAQDVPAAASLIVYACGTSLGDDCFQSARWGVPPSARRAVLEKHLGIFARGGCLGLGEESCNALAELARREPAALGNDGATLLEDTWLRNPGHGPLAQVTAAALLSVGEHARTQYVLQHFLSNTPCATWARLGLAELLEQNAGAQAALDGAAAFECDAVQVPWLIHAAGLMEKTRDFHRAIELLEEAMAHAPSNVIAANNLASLIADHRSSDPQALARALDLIDIIASQDTPHILDTRGWVLTQNGRVTEGLPQLVRAALGLPNDPMVRFHLGMAYELADLPKKAQKELEASLALDQNHLRASEARATIVRLAVKP